MSKIGFQISFDEEILDYVAAAAVVVIMNKFLLLLTSKDMKINCGSHGVERDTFVDTGIFGCGLLDQQM